MKKIAKTIIWSLLLLSGIAVTLSGCARWPDGPEPPPGEPEYQLQITVEVRGVINSDEGKYYIVLDTDENPINGPGSDVSYWDDRFYYIKLEDGFFYFAQVKEGSPTISLAASSYSENKLQVTIALSDIGDPSRVDINVLTTDTENNTYDSLDNYFSIDTTILGSKPPIDDGLDDSGEGGADFDLVGVTTVIKTAF